VYKIAGTLKDFHHINVDYFVLRNSYSVRQQVCCRHAAERECRDPLQIRYWNGIRSTLSPHSFTRYIPIYMPSTSSAPQQTLGNYTRNRQMKRGLFRFFVFAAEVVSNTRRIPPIGSSVDAFYMFYQALRFECLPLHRLSWYLMIPLVYLVGFRFSILRQATFNPYSMPQSPLSLLTHRFLHKTVLVVGVELFNTYQSTETRWFQVECVRKL
jgi:hypothetical protein